MTEGFLATPAQRAVIEAPPDSRLQVLAPAGSGKTEVLRRRVAHLVEEHQLAAGTELLVLSFSRAAVGEMRNRLRAMDDQASYVKCQTFDSFATRLLAEWSPDDAWRSEDYGERIRAATELLNTPSGAEAVETVRHILIDEIQDLVGDRAALVLRLLTVSKCGFTLFGDPAQSIYGFALDDSKSTLTSDEFLEAVGANWSPDLEVLSLSGNFRARSTLASAALGLGPLLVNHLGPLTQVKDRLSEVLAALPRSSLTVAYPQLRKTELTTAILCRYNSQALIISRALQEQAVPHRLQGRATDRSVCRWLALALADSTNVTMSRSWFEERAASVNDPDTPAPDAAWRVLRRMSVASKTSLDLERLHNRLIVGDIPDDLSYAPRSSVVISTVHRAKGLEFDHVMVVDPSDWGSDEHDEDDEALAEMRVIYVALTRARERVMLIGAPDTHFMRRRGCPGKRWVRRPKAWITSDIEVRGEDADSRAPAGALDNLDAVVGIQEYIANSVRPGDSLHFRLRQHVVDGTALFDLIHDGRAAGVSSPEFDNDLKTILMMARHWHNPPVLPIRIGGLRTECVDSVAGLRPIAERAGLGSAAIWLRVRPVGLGNLVWGE